MSYLHSIRSIHEVHPALPAVLGNVDLNRHHAEDDDIEPEHVQHAKFVATALRGVQELGEDEDVVSRQVVLDAEVRHLAVMNAYSATLYQPVGLQDNVADMLRQLRVVNESLRDLNTIVLDNTATLARIDASTKNVRIVSRNSRIQLPARFSPLHKITAGSGAAKARNVAGNHPVIDVNPIPDVGTLPPNFNGNIGAYSNADILRMIVFYNDAFGIVAGDQLAMRTHKFKSFISEF